MKVMWIEKQEQHLDSMQVKFVILVSIIMSDHRRVVIELRLDGAQWGMSP